MFGRHKYLMQITCSDSSFADSEVKGILNINLAMTSAFAIGVWVRLLTLVIYRSGTNLAFHSASDQVVMIGTWYSNLTLDH